METNATAYATPTGNIVKTVVQNNDTWGSMLSRLSSAVQAEESNVRGV